MKTTMAAIDFGTSKILTLVAENDGTQRSDIIGIGIANYDGFSGKMWNNPDALNEAIQSSIQNAGVGYKRQIKEVYVGVPAAYTTVYAIESSVTLKGGAEPQVEPEDVRRVFAEAQEQIKDTVGFHIHSSAAWFRVDEGQKTLEPVGSKGHVLKGFVSYVKVDMDFVQDVNNRLTELGYVVKGFFSIAAGQAMLFLPEQDRDKTAVLIDIGYLNTDVMVMEGDALIYLDTIDLGGGNITADIAQGLDIHMKAAEEIKRSYVFGIATQKTFDVPPMDGQPGKSFSADQVKEIIEARVEEIAEEIQKSIESSGIKLGNWSNMYLTGGGLSLNKGGKDFLSHKLNRTVRDVPNRTVKLNSASFTSVLGLLSLIVDTFEQQRAKEQIRFVDKIKNWYYRMIR